MLQLLKYSFEIELIWGVATLMHVFVIQEELFWLYTYLTQTQSFTDILKLKVLENCFCFCFCCCLRWVSSCSPAWTWTGGFPALLCRCWVYRCAPLCLTNDFSHYEASYYLFFCSMFSFSSMTLWLRLFFIEKKSLLITSMFSILGKIACKPARHSDTD